MKQRWQVVVGLMAWAQLVPTAYAQSPASLACSPSVITGGSGGSATCTVTLGAAAPAGGTVVTLSSSLGELAASLPTVTVPAGQTTANFTVATNPGYRRYSQLAFSAIISASASGTTWSATLNVTAAAAPADFTSGSQAGAKTQWEGLMCGGIAPIGGYPDILYEATKRVRSFANRRTSLGAHGLSSRPRIEPRTPREVRSGQIELRDYR